VIVVGLSGNRALSSSTASEERRQHSKVIWRDFLLKWMRPEPSAGCFSSLMSGGLVEEVEGLAGALRARGEL
jgi:hypothetical protein